MRTLKLFTAPIRQAFIRYRKILAITSGAVALLVTLAAGTLYLWGDRITMAMWNNFHILPEVVTYFNPDHAELALSIGYYSFNTFGRSSYDLEKAEYYLYRSLELDPMVKTGWHQLARIDFLRGNLGAGLIKINRQIELHGDSFPSAYYIRGLIYAFGNRLEEAEQDFLHYLSLREESWAGNNDLAWIYFKQGNYEKTLERAEIGLQHDAHSPWLLMMKGVALINLDRKNEAKPFLEAARKEAEKLTYDDWVRAYPGNDPAIAEQGLAEIKAAIEANLALVD